MALKGDRVEIQTEIHFFMNTTGEQGTIVCHSTGGSGTALDQSQAVVSIAAVASGNVPFGVLLQDVVNLDLTRQHLNEHRDEVQVGQKVAILRKGIITTDRIKAGISPTINQNAYMNESGLFTNTSSNAVAQPWVGRFLGAKDENGWVRVEINLPAPMTASQG